MGHRDRYGGTIRAFVYAPNELLIILIFAQFAFDFPLADHMLSYFLGAAAAGGTADASLVMPADFTSTEHTGRDLHPNSNLHMITEEKQPAKHRATNAHLKRDTEDEEDDVFVPPPTPVAPQFYGKSSSSSGIHPSASRSSEASLTAMAQTLISGGPVVQQKLAEVPSNMSLNSLGSGSGSAQHQSPLSPALMIAHQSQSAENLLLPPESVNSAAQHRAWLQELNARALAARQAQIQGQSNSTPPPTHTHQPQQSFGVSQSSYPPSNPLLPSTAPHLWIGPPQGAHMAMSAAVANAAMTPAESEEKRAKRLERNRESARKSRRKKKERLESLEAAVQLLQSKIAAERLVHMAGMVAGLQANRRAVRANFQAVGAPRIAMRESGPRSSIFQTVVDFSYAALKQDLLPPYQKFCLWLTRQPEGFFLAGKQKYVQARENVSMGRISSKQVGEEWTKDSKGPPLRRAVDEDGNNMAPKHTSYANDAVRFWPLVCYEHQFSVDQEERFLALHKRVSVSDDGTWTQAVESMQAVSSLGLAMTSVCDMASQREERTWVGILRPDQASTFQKWLTRERLDAMRPPYSQSTEEASLGEICRRLKQVAISKATDR